MADAVDTIGRHLDAQVTDDVAAKITARVVQEALDGVVRLRCDHCKRISEKRVGSLRQFKELWELVKAKPADPVRRVAIDVTHRDYRELSDDELRAIERGEAVVEGDWDELPNPAT